MLGLHPSTASHMTATATAGAASQLGQTVTPEKSLVEADDSASSSTVGSEASAHSSVSQQGMAQALHVAALEQQLLQLTALVQRMALAQSGGASSLQVAASSVPPQQQPQQQQQQQPQQQPQQQQQVRVDAVRLPELTYTGATTGSTLEDWLFKLEQRCAQQGVAESDWSGRVLLAETHWDRNMALWWSGQQAVAAAAGAPVGSWAAFKAALRRQFIPVGDAQLARSELLKLRMSSGEAMGAYLQRALLLVVRAAHLVDDGLAAVLTLQGLDKSRFPFTHAKALAQQTEAEVAGVAGMSFPQMRAALTAAAVAEPQLSGRGGAGGSGSAGGSSSGGSKGGVSHKQHRINVLEQQLKAARAEEDAAGSDSEADDSYSTAPLSTGSGGQAGPLRCNKCGGEGHWSADCKSKKELRSCFHCRKAGHVRSACPERSKKGKRGEGEGPATAAAASAGSNKPTSKNE
jgi:hypothetical protein